MRSRWNKMAIVLVVFLMLFACGCDILLERTKLEVLAPPDVEIIKAFVNNKDINIKFITERSGKLKFNGSYDQKAVHAQFTITVDVEAGEEQDIIAPHDLPPGGMWTVFRVTWEN